METINQATAAVKSTLWGSNTDGQTYGGQSEVHKSMIDDSVTETKFNGRTESDPDAEGAYQPENRDTDKRPGGPISTGGHPQGDNVTGDQNTNKNPFSSSNEPNTGFGGVGAQPSVAADPSSGQQINPKSQGSSRPGEEPEEASTFSGKSDSSGSSGLPPPTGDSGSSSMGGMKLPESENKSKGEGTGTLYEKSSGLHCDGGDFDATRPGAAREAARLMDEKGIGHGVAEGGGSEPPKEKKWYGVDHSGFGGHGSHQNKRPSVASTTSHPEEDRPYQQQQQQETDFNDGPEKKGLSQKIKEKIHLSSN